MMSVVQQSIDRRRKTVGGEGRSDMLRGEGRRTAKWSKESEFSH